MPLFEKATAAWEGVRGLEPSVILARSLTRRGVCELGIQAPNMAVTSREKEMKQCIVRDKLICEGKGRRWKGTWKNA